MTAQPVPSDLTFDLDGLVSVLRDPATLCTPPHDDAGMVGKPWTEDAVLRTLWRHFTGQSWAAVPQVTVNALDLDNADTALSQWEQRRRAHTDDSRPFETVLNDGTDRRIDMLAARRPRKTELGPLETLAIEVKVTRGDFLSDVKNPAKQAAWRRAATRHAYAVPAGLVSADEVPEGSGLIAVKHSGDGWGEAEWVRRAPYLPNHRPTLPPRVLIATLWRIASLEGHTRGWVNTPLAMKNDQELRAAVQAADEARDRAENALAGLDGKMRAWRQAYLLLAKDGHPCDWCGQPVKPLNPTARGVFRSWRHIDKADDGPCAAAETAKVEQEAREAYETADQSDRDWRVRLAQQHSPSWRVDEVEREPWRAFYDTDHRTFKPILAGPKPADVLPEGATAP